MIETELFCTSLSNFADILPLRGWTLLIVEVKGQGHTMDFYGKNLVNTMIETELLCASSLNLAYILIMLRGWTLLSLEVKGQGHWQM